MSNERLDFASSRHTLMWIITITVVAIAVSIIIGAVVHYFSDNWGDASSAAAVIPSLAGVLLAAIALNAYQKNEDPVRQDAYEVMKARDRVKMHLDVLAGNYAVYRRRAMAVGGLPPIVHLSENAKRAHEVIATSLYQTPLSRVLFVSNQGSEHAVATDLTEFLNVLGQLGSLRENRDVAGGGALKTGDREKVDGKNVRMLVFLMAELIKRIDRHMKPLSVRHSELYDRMLQPYGYSLSNAPELRFLNDEFKRMLEEEYKQPVISTKLLDKELTEDLCELLAYLLTDAARGLTIDDKDRNSIWEKLPEGYEPEEYKQFATTPQPLILQTMATDFGMDLLSKLRLSAAEFAQKQGFEFVDLDNNELDKKEEDVKEKPVFAFMKIDHTNFRDANKIKYQLEYLRNAAMSYLIIDSYGCAARDNYPFQKKLLLERNIESSENEGFNRVEINKFELETFTIDLPRTLVTVTQYLDPSASDVVREDFSLLGKNMIWLPWGVE